ILIGRSILAGFTCRTTPQVCYINPELCTTSTMRTLRDHKNPPKESWNHVKRGDNFVQDSPNRTGSDPMDDSTQSEIQQLRREIERLQRQLQAQQLPVRSDTASLIENHELIQDLARFCEGIVTERNVRKKHRLAESDWERLGSDEVFIETIKRERERRVRNGSVARERAPKIFTETPEVLGDILKDDEAAARHRIEAAWEIRAVASVGPETQSPAERFVFTINLGAGEVIHVDQPMQPNARTIERESFPMIEDDGNDKPI